MKDLNVLIVEDDPMVVEIHKKYILSVEGFRVLAEANNGVDALNRLEEEDIDLIVLDVFMPQLDGIQTLNKIRKKRKDIDVIVVSAAKEVETIKETLRLGAFDYIVKPFKFERFKAALESYKHYYQKIAKATKFDQQTIDNIIIPKFKKEYGDNLPKGLQAATLKRIVDFLLEKRTPFSADEVAKVFGISRVTVRRYSEYLVASGQAVVEPLYQEVGRPINKYKLL